MGRLSKVEISGVNTANLPVLTREEAKALFLRVREGDKSAREKNCRGGHDFSPNAGGGRARQKICGGRSKLDENFYLSRPRI